VIPERPIVSSYFPPRSKPDEPFGQIVHDNLTVPNYASSSEYFEAFSRIARFLLCDCLLSISDQLFRLLEIEFYLVSPSHQDPFCHAHEDQQSVAKWYFHRAGSGADSGYRGGTRKGLDLTFGQADGSTKGGILLRGMCQVNEKGEELPDRTILGPSKLVDELLSLSGAPSLKDVSGAPISFFGSYADIPRLSQLVDVRWAGDTSAVEASPSRLHLVPSPPDAPPPPEPLATARIGLDLSHQSIKPPFAEHPRVIFLPKPYRFLTNFASDKRPQTALATNTASLRWNTAFNEGISGLGKDDKEDKEGEGGKKGKKGSKGAKGSKGLEEFVGPKAKSLNPVAWNMLMGTLRSMDLC
jgi:hypothetical protein